MGKGESESEREAVRADALTPALSHGRGGKAAPGDDGENGIGAVRENVRADALTPALSHGRGGKAAPGADGEIGFEATGADPEGRAKRFPLPLGEG